MLQVITKRNGAFVFLMNKFEKLHHTNYKVVIDTHFKKGIWFYHWFDKKEARERLYKKSVKQKGIGKFWLKSDRQPIHLEFTYKFYNDRIVDLYLEGKIPQENPRLIENESL